MKDVDTLWLIVQLSMVSCSHGTPVIYHHTKCPSKSSGIHWLEISGHHDFDYNDQDDYGPDHWQCFWIKCQGPFQSPVDISPQGSVFYQHWGVTHTGLKAFRGNFLNNGHAPTFKLTEPGSILSTWTERESMYTPVNCQYRLLQFHFHFSGPHGGKGSEHSVNGRHYDAEMHMVHYNTQFYSFTEAMDQPNGLAVVGVFLEATGRRKSTFDNFIEMHEDGLKYFSKKGVTCQFNPGLLFPNSNEMVYYRGSLTTPGCHETVNWFMMKEPVKIHPQTLAIFRKMRDKSGNLITKYGDRRPVQRLMGRRLLTNFNLWI